MQSLLSGTKHQLCWGDLLPSNTPGSLAGSSAPPSLTPVSEFTNPFRSRFFLSLFCQPHPPTLETQFLLALYFLPLASSPINHLAKAPSQLEPWDRQHTCPIHCTQSVVWSFL